MSVGTSTLRVVSSDGQPTPSMLTPAAWDRATTPPLPTALTSLVGREADIAAVLGLLASGQRLVTITGPGGVGKSRLSLAVAAAAGSYFTDGVWFAPLAAVTRSDQVLPAIARLFGLAEGGRPLAERLPSHLRDRRLLLVLDNFEQVADAGPAIASLVAAVPTLAVLVTSRVPLHVSGERHYRLRPIPVPSPDTDYSIEELLAGPAVALFLDRAAVVRPEPAPSRENLLAIAALCRRLDGLPLAIELAAARSKVLSPQMMADRLEQSLLVLGSGPRDAPDRHRTMRATIAWSYDLLSPADQEVFRRLAVFSGGFTLAAAEAVAGEDALDPLASLLDHNLIHQETSPAGEDRFSLLETIREFGREQLAADAAAEATRERHARWLLDLAAGLARDLYGVRQAVALDVLQAEHANLRAATTWIAENGRLDLLTSDALESLARFWLIRGPLVEGRRWIDDILAMVAPDSLDRARLLNHAGYMARHQRKFTEAATLFQESLTIFERLGDTAGRARVLHNLGGNASQSGDDPAATRYFESSQVLFRELNDQAGIALSVYNLGVIAVHEGDYARATELLTAALTAQRKLGDTDRIAMAIYFLGVVAQGEHNLERALALHEEAVALWRQIGSWQTVGHGVFWVGRIARLQGDLRRCVEVIIESIGLVQAEDDLWHIATCLLELAVVASVTGDHLQAARLLGAAERLRDWRSMSFFADERADYERVETQARLALGEAAYEAARSDGRRLSLSDLLTAAALLGRPKPAAAGDGKTIPDELASLSPREIDVLRLIVAGYSDRQIGDALYISHRTVMKHVSHILEKLDVENRAAAQAYARRHGLAE